MKCLKKDSEIIRVTDAKAEQLVKNGEFEYCSKSEWKVVRDAVRVENKKSREKKDKQAEKARQNAVTPPTEVETKK